MSELVAIVLAAGKGTRMKSELAKVLHPIMGRPMLAYSLETLNKLGVDKIIAVVGYQAEAVKAAFSSSPVTFVTQEPQLGTGHAVQVACQALGGYQGSVLVVCGDVPLLPSAYLEALYHQHCQTGVVATVLTVELAEPGSYGRIVKDGQGNILKIVEARDAKPEELSIREINTGIYCFHVPFLVTALGNLRPDNDQQELYLTDVIAQAQARNLQVASLRAPEAMSFQGINNRVDLAVVSRQVRQQINERHMLAGVTLIDPETTYIEADVQIGPDTVIYPNCYLLGSTTIGPGCCLEPNVKIADSTLGARVIIKMSTVITGSVIADEVQIGPFAHLRPQSEIRERAKIGNFVEVKKSLIHTGVKAGHLTYLGDAEVGPEVNVGAGTITCNYDGQKKYRTVIEAGAFIGSNTALVAPVTVGAGAYVGAGSTITEDVPPDKLAIARGRQVIKEIKPR
ncbi:MAG: bifunctional UDP-N-acetylglucosamine diphosphorylase/glucosamine-1-phosphate N-acetyltransferase GlmU [Deltaproteobacteria bacterium]|nr:bifunctional UDP-N-acetylglucosamine diphosphorylase/glucosamine-1-phosphate N-acetyltransferase GlmU [Deltaproteobacteria bacterium]MBW1951722.1 bifunctional UDP-N-acetylglucosamine diphosphorylase/glucosamine-1-phosphate N-acetyltransferase GlmU [Deltaproteobacteria bacterium]MBW1987256.1 bifunctional UDP-N-acetylglucosamine diphosphorylase/glucosamine-1-phosphate N-acetyltransferase GlmU [Deltaproteobacteria bacterium]MBW2134735.1 bifunctional UDP-N-acetylglucosamine diphosphorylase/glucos